MGKLIWEVYFNIELSGELFIVILPDNTVSVWSLGVGGGREGWNKKKEERK